METLKKYRDNILLIGFTLSMIIYSTVVSSQTSHTLPTEYMNATKDITDVDSVFETNLSKLYTVVNDKSKIMISSSISAIPSEKYVIVRSTRQRHYSVAGVFIITQPVG